MHLSLISRKSVGGGGVYFYTSIYEVAEIIVANTTVSLTLFRMGLFGTADRWGAKSPPPPLKICHTYPAMMKLGTVIPCLKDIQKIYESRDTPLELC